MELDKSASYSCGISIGQLTRRKPQKRCQKEMKTFQKLMKNFIQVAAVERVELQMI